MVHSVERAVGDRTLRIESGRLAYQAGGAVTVRYGDTVVLVTACMSEEPREGGDFLPLTVDYEERLYAAGKIPGGFIRREGRPSEDAVLAARLVDRPLRPLFPPDLRNDLQVVITVLSVDQENDPDVLAIIGASAALSISSIPFQGPVGAVRLGYINGKLVINPTFSQLAKSQLDLVVVGTKEGVMMVEAGASEVEEALICEAMGFSQDPIRQAIELQEKLVDLCGQPKIAGIHTKADPVAREAAASFLNGRLDTLLELPSTPEREKAIGNLKAEMLAKLGESHPAPALLASFDGALAKALRRNILGKGIRLNRRGKTEIRPIASEVGILPRTHGSGLFSRGQTQVLSIVTLGSPGEQQRLDGITPEESKRFMHHYNFPPFSTGETGRIGAPRRREIGHGALVERALLPVIPSEDDFPYTIRLVSEVLSSNGSTSMASVCGSTLALMDAGVPIRAPVGGVAMGLIQGNDGQLAILTDIEGIEDAFGDMDFKVAGTAQGITALQMDIKVPGIPLEVMEQALEQARQARLFIIDRMLDALGQSRAELSPYAPRMLKMQVHPDKIRLIIGPGGKTIRSITEECKVTIDVEDDGTVFIGSPSEEAAQKAVKIIEGLTRDVEVGAIYTGKVTRLMSFGAFVEILPGKEGLVHISELADYRVASVEDVVQVGDEIMVMVTEIDRQGRINLSRRAVIQGLQTAPARASADIPRAPAERRLPQPPAGGERRPSAPRPRPPTSQQQRPAPGDPPRRPPQDSRP